MAEVSSLQTGINGILKNLYLPGIVSQINDEIIPLLQIIERNGEDIVGAGDIKVAFGYGRHGGIGNRAENGTFPTAGYRRVVQATWGTKNIFGIFQITDKMIEGAANDRVAFANVLDTQLEALITDVKDNFARQCFGNGSGVLANVGEDMSAGSTTIPVSSTQYLAEGQQIDILDASNNYSAISGAANVTITSVDRANNQIVISGTGVQAADEDVIVISGNYGNELTGLGAVFQTSGTIYGLDRSTYKFLIPTIKAINGGMSDLTIQAGIDAAMTLVGEEPDTLLCSFGVARAFQYYLSARRMTLETVKLESGAEVLSYNGKTIIKDRYSQPGRLYMLNSKDWKLHQIDEFKWREDGGTILQKLEDRPISQAVLYKFCDLGCRRPIAQVLLTGIEEK